MAFALLFAACSSDETADDDQAGAGGSIIKIGSGGLPSFESGSDAGTGAGGAGALGGIGGKPATGGGSCRDACGQISTDGCYCDLECEVHDDCCADFAFECKSKMKALPFGCVNDPYFFVLCNPVDNDGCDAALGEACDWMTGGLTCWSEGNTEPAGGACDTKANKYCVPMHTCDGASNDSPSGVCKKYCCSSADCGGGPCKAFDQYFGTLGVCEVTVDAGADAQP